MSRVGISLRREVEPCAEPLEKRLGREQLRPRRGELDRERQVVEPGAELVHGGRRCQLGPDGARAGDEELAGLVRGQRREIELRLGADAERLAARHEQPQAGRRRRCCRQRFRGGREQLLDVVDHDVRPSGADAVRDLVPAAVLPRRSPPRERPARERGRAPARAVRRGCRRPRLPPAVGRARSRSASSRFRPGRRS